MTSADGSQVDPIQGYDGGDPPLWLIIAIAVGCLIFILLIICLIVCCIKRSRRIDQDDKIDGLREELGLGIEFPMEWKEPRNRQNRLDSSNAAAPLTFFILSCSNNSTVATLFVS